MSKQLIFIIVCAAAAIFATTREAQTIKPPPHQSNNIQVETLSNNVSFSEKVLSFVEQYKGKNIDWDKAIGYQCVDLANAWHYHLTGGVKPLIKLGAAKQFATKPELFVTPPIQYSQSNTPRLGSLAVWGEQMGNGDGHIALVIAIRENEITVLEQDGLNQSVPIQEKTYLLEGKTKPINYLFINIETKLNTI